MVEKITGAPKLRTAELQSYLLKAFAGAFSLDLKNRWWRRVHPRSLDLVGRKGFGYRTVPPVEEEKTVANRRRGSSGGVIIPVWPLGALVVVGVYSRALATRAGGETEGRCRIESRV